MEYNDDCFLDFCNKSKGLSCLNGKCSCPVNYYWRPLEMVCSKCPPDWEIYNNNFCYKLFSSFLDRSTADATCSNYQASLIQLQDRNKFDFFINRYQTNFHVILLI